MDSINKNQPEDYLKDLSGSEAVSKMKTLIDKASSCFFCTRSNGKYFATRPMAVQKTDDDGNIWFLSANDSHKNREIAENNEVQLLFQGSPHSDFLQITGHAIVSKDKKKIHELWNPIMKTWFTEGEDDPRISVIKVEATEGYYWDTKNPMPISFLKRLAGAAVGKTLDDSIEGKINI